jgi:DNA primase
MPGIDLRQVRREITIQQVLDLLGFMPATRKGSRLRGPCPIHGDSRPQSRALSVHLGYHRYRCFRCHSAGTQLDLWAAVHNLSIYAAARDLCRRLGIPIPYLLSTRIGQYPAK